MSAKRSYCQYNFFRVLVALGRDFLKDIPPPLTVGESHRVESGCVGGVWGCFLTSYQISRAAKFLDGQGNTPLHPRQPPFHRVAVELQLSSADASRLVGGQDHCGMTPAGRVERLAGY